MLAACLLTDEPVILHNMPDIGDVRTLIEIMRRLGVQIDWLGESTPARSRPRSRPRPTSMPTLAQKLRSSIVLAGPLLARCGRVYLPPPGGDAIGERRLDMHVFALRKLGAIIQFDSAFDMQADTADRRGYSAAGSQRHRHRERDHGGDRWRAARPFSATPPANRTFRICATCWSAWARTSTALARIA